MVGEKMTAGRIFAERFGRMHNVLAGYVERGELSGLVALASRRRDVEVDIIGKMAFSGSPMQRDTIFRISSMTKPLIAAAAMVLVEEGKLDLDEPVDRLLPELADRQVLRRLEGPLGDTVPAIRPITVRDLLTFRMSFGIVMAPPGRYPIQKAMDQLHLGQEMPSPLTPPRPNEWIRRLGTLPLMHQPGEKWMYNTGADVLGVLIARASGQHLETFLQERIFKPLAMKDTSFSVPPSKLDRLSTSYWTNPKTGALELYDDPAQGQWSRPPDFPSGGGGLVSTVDDYLAFGKMMLNNGKHGERNILSRGSVELMTTDQLTPEQKAVSGLVAGFFDSNGWGFGMSVITRRHDVRSVGTYGWDGGMGTSWYSDPQKEVVTLLMTQRAWTSPSPPDVCLDFRTSAYQAIEV